MPEGERILIILWHFYYKDMADLSLDILVVPTYSSLTLGILDNSVYVTDPPTVTTPTINITPPGFDDVNLTFTFNETNIFDSADLGITEAGVSQPLPDGIYYLSYSVYDSGTTVTVKKSIMRTENIQEKFDEAFMTLDMMECDGKIKKQSKVDLMSIYFFIQGAISAANNCATDQAAKLYNKADSMLNNFINNDCGCSGSNYIYNG